MSRSAPRWKIDDLKFLPINERIRIMKELGHKVGEPAEDDPNLEQKTIDKLERKKFKKLRETEDENSFYQSTLKINTTEVF